MTHELANWLNTEGQKETGKVLKFKKGTKTYKLKSDPQIGGHFTMNDMEDANYPLPFDLEIKETKEIKEFGYASYSQPGESAIMEGHTFILDIRDAENYTNHYAKYIIIGIIIAIAIGLIIWKHKQK